MWWTLLANLAIQQTQPGQLPAYQAPQQQSQLPIILAVAAGLGVAGYVAFKVLK